MLYMVIGRFRSDAAASGSARPAGVSLTQSSGLTHIGSWVEATLGRCFQVVECSDVAALHQWDPAGAIASTWRSYRFCQRSTVRSSRGRDKLIRSRRSSRTISTPFRTCTKT